MQARLKTSKKWTQFPQEFIEQISAVFNDNFDEYLDQGKIVIEGRIYPNEILFRAGYLENGKLRQSNFEASVDYDAQSDQESVLKKIHLCVDASASMMMEYFELDGEVDFPYTWKAVPFKNHEVFMQMTTENSDLEKEANKLLGLTDENLYNEESENEDALDRANEKAVVNDDGDVEFDVHEDEEGEEFYEDDDEDLDDDDLEDDDEVAQGTPRMFGGKKKKPNLH